MGDFNLPEPRRDYPVNYVLDGQQRLTSLFSAFQTELTPETDSWTDIYFDMRSPTSLQESYFFALTEVERDPRRHFPVRTFFDTVKHREETKGLPDSDAELVDKVQERFKEYRIQNQTCETTDTNEVAIVFERINRAGTELDVFSLLAAWSWSEDFDLVQRFSDLQDKIDEHNYADLGRDRDLQLRICAAVITGETSPSKILKLQGEDIRRRFPEIETGILGAIDFLRRELKVEHFAMLPFSGILVPLSVFFASSLSDGVSYTARQRNILIQWFWRSLFTRRFSAGVTEKQAADIKEMRALREDEEHEFRLPRQEVRFDFRKDRFAAGTANSKTLILMLTHKQPHSLLSGARIELNKVLKKGARHEFHHIFPRAYLERLGVEKASTGALANFCFLTRHDNNKIKDKSPAEYFTDLPPAERDDYLGRALCEYGDKDLDYADFLKERSSRLVDFANALAK